LGPDATQTLLKLLIEHKQHSSAAAPRLRRVDLSHNALGDAGVHALCSALMRTAPPPPTASGGATHRTTSHLQPKDGGIALPSIRVRMSRFVCVQFAVNNRWFSSNSHV
jgi:hypothetical protein